jgi:dTDP-3-amino-3,4,6-trideoxy-alpha-D-glucose transaminase
METVPLLDVQAAGRELEPALSAAIGRVVRSGWFIGGDDLAAFEAEWAAYCGVRRAVGTGNGLDALTLGLRALAIGPGDEVVVPSFTFIATWLAVSAVGALPVGVDVDLATGNIDPERLADAVGPRTRGIVPVHLYGQPADMDAVWAIAANRGVAVVEDAAQAHGARWRGRPAGGFGTLGAFSFYPVKNLGALGDAGAVVTDDDALADAVRRLGNYGAAHKYDHEVVGTNSRLDPIQAAVLGVKLAVLDDWNERRRRVAAAYGEQLSGLDWLELPVVREGADPVWHLFVVRCPWRDELRDHLAARGVETGLHYPQPPHRSGAYRGLGLRLPNADRLAETVLSLPMGPHLAPSAVERVVEAVRAFVPRRSHAADGAR